MKASREIGFNNISDMQNERDEAAKEDKTQPMSGKAQKYQVQKPLTYTGAKAAKPGSDMLVNKGSGKKPNINVNATPTSLHDTDDIPDERKSMRFSLDQDTNGLQLKGKKEGLLKEDDETNRILSGY